MTEEATTPTPAPSEPAPQPEFIVLEDYRPIVESLDWRVSQTYWHLRGAQAFTTQEVPNLINNNGVSAHKAANVFFEACCAAEDAGTLEREIHVVELAVGLGLHARFFLDRLRDRCTEENRDFYNRIVFYATDLSRKTLEDILYQQTLTPHAPRVRFGSINAMTPNTFIDHESGETHDLSGKPRLVMLNYLLDVLPFDLLWRSQDWWGEMRIQTRFGDIDKLPRQYDRDAIRSLSARATGDDILELAKVHSFFQVHRAFYPIDITNHPFGAEVLRFADEVLQPLVDEKVEPGADVRLTSSRGAIWALDAMLDTIHPDGFLLFADYGSGKPEDVLSAVSYQLFGGGGGMGVNFPFIDHYMQHIRSRAAHISKPEGDVAASIHLRCLSLAPQPELHAAFQREFDRASYDALTTLLKEARDANNEHKNVEQAQTLYEEACEKHPEHWVLRHEVARFFHYVKRDAQAALGHIQEALRLNPTGSSELWCEYGDIIYEMNAFIASHQAFSRAIEINPESARAQYNIAWTYNDLGKYDEALEHCAKGLACDPTDLYRERLTKLQDKILDARAEYRKASKARRDNRFMVK